MAGEGTRENREREGYGRREKKGREAGSLGWAGSRIEFKKASFRCLCLSSSQRNEPNNNPLPPPPQYEIRTVPGLQTSFLFLSFVGSLAVTVFFVVLFFSFCFSLF